MIALNHKTLYCFFNKLVERIVEFLFIECTLAFSSVGMWKVNDGCINRNFTKLVIEWLDFNRNKNGDLYK